MRTRLPLTLGLAVAAAVSSLAATVPATAATPAKAREAAASPQRTSCPQLSRSLKWYGENRTRLQRMIDERGTCSHPTPGPQGRPVAAFDWDNTVVKNDISDATLAWALRHDKLLRPKSWKATSPWMTRAAHRALTRACGTAVPVGRPLPTSKNTACADEIMEIRESARTMSGAAAFAGEWNHRRTRPEYAWIPQLFAGLTPAQLTSYAERARTENLAAPIGTEQTVGTHKVAGYIRYYDQQKDLIRTLKAAGFRVYVVSASAETIAEAWSGGVGIDRAHTIGVRSLVRNGRLTTGIRGCGDVRDGHGEVLPYIDGKRCLINQEIFKIKGAEAWRLQDPAHRIALGGGDADTDVTFVGDATGAHLVINRNKAELMCRAYDDADRRWVVNPMFIAPLPRRSGTYPCATKGYTNTDGAPGPVRRADGTVVPDQKDHIHA
ncbi:haloacid dehalogenase-like hydrolase [Streptomyces sp. MST-110588]|uniref:haloacid dehalogenase-like hydrolase n=1 Tax=Streptomyces sp. MST-110588 TaxID=2833628 RepID=UPI001F5C9F60|nr:haloacid dehalogenase-like hydrolase [Streptomyces sp. MST-110588]UNO39115.1 haloacid dehalogenase-like hydrolase [Streptomyces sp. MST-110588]